jgi:hypothetical protein
LDVASGAREVKDTIKEVLEAAAMHNKLWVIQRFCSILGLEDPATPRTWTEAEWQGLIPAFNELWDPADPESLTVSDHARAVFGVQEHRLVGEGERKVVTTPSRLLMLEVDSVLRRWSGTSIRIRRNILWGHIHLERKCTECGTWRRRWHLEKEVAPGEGGQGHTAPDEVSRGCSREFRECA